MSQLICSELSNYTSFQDRPQPIKESSWLNLYSSGQFWNLSIVNVHSDTEVAMDFYF